MIFRQLVFDLLPGGRRIEENDAVAILRDFRVGDVIGQGAR